METLQNNIRQACSDLNAIKEAIVEKGVNIPEGAKSSTYANKIDDVYEAGKQAEYDAFWDRFQKDSSGNVKTYLTNAFAGAGWCDDNFKPKYDIKPVGNAAGIFRQTNVQNFKKCLEDSGVVLDLSQATSVTYAFAYTNTVRILPKLDFSSATETNQAFYQSKNIESIEELKVSATTAFVNNVFYGCTGLTHLIMAGELASAFNTQWCTKLDKASITSIMNCLSVSTSGLTATFSKTAVNKAFETSEGANDGSESLEWTALKATKSNWTISLV